jgi:hypothetical protein
LFFHLCVVAVIAYDTLPCGLAVRYGVFTPLIAAAKNAIVLMIKNVFTQFILFRTLVWAIEATNRRGKPSAAAHWPASFPAHVLIANGASRIQKLKVYETNHSSVG